MWWSPWCQGSKSRCCWYQWRWREYGRNYTSWATRIAKLCPPGKNLSGPLTHITRYQPKCPKTSKGASKHLTTSFILHGCKDCQTLKKNWSIVTTDATVSLLLAQFPGWWWRGHCCCVQVTPQLWSGDMGWSSGWMSTVYSLQTWQRCFKREGTYSWARPAWTLTQLLLVPSSCRKCPSAPSHFDDIRHLDKCSPHITYTWNWDTCPYIPSLMSGF